jgi:EAL domain-containing protein (putative c-di-GMP-specific phosphodiesterase class I)
MPKRAARTRALAGVEALVRWPHAKLGAVAPDEFVPLAEQSGLIHPLTRWVVTEAARQTAAWRRDGLELSCSVNISARNLLDPALPRHVERICRSVGLDPGALVFEITETALMEDPARALSGATALVGLGARLAIDDFGTGYSSLSYLRNFPFDILKVDKAFVTGVARGGPDAAFARTIIALAEQIPYRTLPLVRSAATPDGAN